MNPETVEPIVAQKRPRMRESEEHTTYVQNDDVPDLAAYFAEFDLCRIDQIRCCRTYANFLAQLERAAK